MSNECNVLEYFEIFADHPIRKRQIDCPGTDILDYFMDRLIKTFLMTAKQ